MPGLYDDIVAEQPKGLYDDLTSEFQSIESMAQEGRRQLDLGESARSPEELAIKNAEARKQLQQYGFFQPSEPQPRGGLGGLYDFLATPTTDIISKSLSFTAQQLRDAREVLGTSGAQAEGFIGPEEAEEALAEPSQPPTRAEKIATGAHRAVVESFDFFTSPVGMMTLGTFKLPVPAQRVVAASFVADMARHTPEQLRELNEALKTDDPERQAKAATALGLTGAFIKGGVSHALQRGAPVRADAGDQLPKVEIPPAPEQPTIGATRAVQERPAGEVIRTVPEQPVQGERQVPTEEGAGRVPPRDVQPQEAQAREIPLRPEESLYRDIVEEAPIEGRQARARSVWDFPEDELNSFFTERELPVEQRGRGKYNFTDYDQFKQWMDDRYTERDLVGMQEGFAEVDTAFKVRYIKENRQANQHLKDWIGNIATGSPLPAADGPKVRTTPRPMPGTTGAPPPPPPPPGTGTPPPTGGPPPGAQPPPPGAGPQPPPPGAGPQAPPPPPPPPPPPHTMPMAEVGGPRAKPMRASEIIKDMATTMERPIRVGHIGGRRTTLGIFKTRAEVARLRRANDIPTAAHEMAHMLERMHRRALGNGTDIGRAAWENQLPAGVLAELRSLDYNPAAARPYEGFAEFMRYYLTERNTQARAPQTHAWFESEFLRDTNLADAIGSIREKVVEFENQGAVNRLRSMLRMFGEESKKPLAERLKSWWNTQLTRWSDDLRPLEKLEQEIMQGGMALGEVSPTKTARVVTQSSGARARHWALRGMTDFAANTIGPSLKEIFGREGINGDEINGILYAVANRVLEKHAQGIHPGIEQADAAYAANVLRTPARERFAQEIRDWNEGALAYLRDAGGISQETFDAITQGNQAYIPFFRIFEEQLGSGFAAGGRRIGDTPQPIKKLKGSGREIRDPIGSMQQHANQIISVADKIRTSRALVDLVESKVGFGKWVEEIPATKVPIEFDINRIKDQLQQAGADLSQANLDAVMTLFTNSQRKPGGANIVSFVRDGKRHYYELDPELYRALQALDYHQIHPFLNMILGRWARSVRLGATGLDPSFALMVNPIRDFKTMMLQSKGNPLTAARLMAEHLGKQIGMRDTEIKSLWQATGGELTQPLGMDRKSLKTSIDEVLANSAKRKALHIIRHPIEFAREALSFPEAAPRLAEFEMTLREMGWQPGQPVTNSMAIEAANRAAEVTVNFKRAGSYGRVMNQIVAFHNPAVQGLFKFARAHRENPKGAVMRGLALITLPAVTNWLMNRDDPEWKRLPAYIKWGFLNFKIGGEWIRIPTPFEWWYAYGAVPVATLDSMYNKNPKALGEALTQATKQMTPPVLPSAVVPPIEVLANRSFLTGKPIITQREKELAPSAQAKPWTSQTLQYVTEVLSQGGVEVSPAKIEHILNGETGGLWGDLIGTAERAAKLTPPEVSDEPANLPVVGRFFVRDSQSEVIDTMYTDLAHLKGRREAYKKFSNAGDYRRANKYELTVDESMKLARLEAAAQTLTNLRKTLKQAETRKERQDLFQRMKEIAENALNPPE